jgi:hypothetical protein
MIWTTKKIKRPGGVRAARYGVHLSLMCTAAQRIILRAVFFLWQ